MANREELTALMVRIQEDFARFVNNIEHDDLTAATKYMQSLADRMRTVLSEIEQSLTADFLGNRAKSFEADVALIKKFETEAPSRADQSDIAAAVMHFSNSIRALDNLVKLIYPKDPYSVKLFVKRYRRQVATVTAVLLAAALAAAGIGHMRRIRHGLMGEYYASQTLQNLYKRRLDPTISFRFGRGGPFMHWRTDYFSIRWTGYLHIPVGGRWSLITYSDDGVRLFLGKKLIIDDWTVHGATARTATLDLAEGYYPIIVEYFEARSSANMELFWKGGRQKKAKPIPTQFLVPSAQYLDQNIPVIEDLDHPEGVSPDKDDDGDRGDGAASNEGRDDQDGGNVKAPPAKRR